MSPKHEGWGGGHIVFGADPVNIGVRVASFPCIINNTMDFDQTCIYTMLGGETS